MAGWNQDPAWVELSDIIAEKVSKDVGMTDTMFNALMENVQFCYKNLNVSNIRVGTVTTKPSTGSSISVTITNRIETPYTYIDFVFFIPDFTGEAGIIISDTQPADPNVIWLKPNGSSALGDWIDFDSTIKTFEAGKTYEFLVMVSNETDLRYCMVSLPVWFAHTDIAFDIFKISSTTNRFMVKNSPGTAIAAAAYREIPFM